MQSVTNYLDVERDNQSQMPSIFPATVVETGLRRPGPPRGTRRSSRRRRRSLQLYPRKGPAARQPRSAYSGTQVAPTKPVGLVPVARLSIRSLAPSSARPGPGERSGGAKKKSGLTGDDAPAAGSREKEEGRGSR